MRFNVVHVFALAAVCACPVVAEEAEPEAVAPKEDPELEAEIAYVEALVNYGYPDFAAPVIEATKKKWPSSEVRFFAIEIRGMLALGQFEAAEKKIAALPDRKSVKFWAARLEVANNYFGRGQKAECMKIYDEFFTVFPKPPPEIRKFYVDACYAFGQLLAGDGQYAKAVERYEALLKMVKDDLWCNLACETCDLYLKLIDKTSDPKQAKVRDGYIKAASKIADKLLWQLEKPVYFGRAVSMKAHVEQLRGNSERASALIDEYRPQLQELHDQIVQFDPDGKQGLLKQSPLPQCLYLQAEILFAEAKNEYKKTKRDDERVKSLMFGPKGKAGGKREVSKGAFAMAQGVFLNYETSSWAPQAGELVEEIRKFAEEKYKAKIKVNITAEQIARVRAAQFKEANEKFGAGQYKDAIEAYYAVLAKFPEYPESIMAVENVASAYLDLILETKDEAEKVEFRDNADAVEAYLAERFAGAKDKSLMIAAGDAVVRLAAKEAQYKNPTRADWLYGEFCRNYTRHSSAANVAAARAAEQQKNGRYADALKFWKIVADTYTNASVYAISHQKVSECLGKLGDSKGEIAWIEKYLTIETVKIRRLQAQMRLAQMYQNRGLAMLDAASTNATPEAVEADERAGTAQIIRAIKNFQRFSKEAASALEDPSTPPGDKEKYAYLREAAMFLVGECWSRMNRPQEKVEKLYRPRAAEAYSAYLAAYPEGKWATKGYVKLGTIYTALGDIAKAKDALDTLSKKFPESDEAKNAKPRLAKSLIEMGMRKEGTEIYAEMLRTDGAYTAGQFLNAGEALIDAKSWDLANQAYERAIRLAGTNSITTVARARLGLAKTSWKQGSLAEAREALDAFLNDPKMSKMAIAADANFMMVEIASEQGRTEKDATMRQKYFGAAIGALKKVRQYWKQKPQAEQDRLDLISGDVLVNRMKAEEAMGLKDEARETCAKAAAHFQIFVQSHGPTEEVPLDKMEAGLVDNLERAYATMVPLFAQLGAEQADRVMKFGQEYLDSFPNGKDRTKIVNCMNQAKADLPASAVPAAPAAAE